LLENVAQNIPLQEKTVADVSRDYMLPDFNDFSEVRANLNMFSVSARKHTHPQTLSLLSYNIDFSAQDFTDYCEHYVVQNDSEI
jgi:hypothetical protein